MKLNRNNQRKSETGYAIAFVLIFTAISLALLAGVLFSASTNSSITHRNNQYFTTVEASEAATEKVIAKLSTDFLSQGASTVSSHLSSYRSSVPTSSENAVWNNFAFKDKSGNSGATEVDLMADWANTALISQYQGLNGYAATYRIASLAQNLGAKNLTAGVQQDIQIATVPVFQFAIFYNLDMEICPGPNMMVTGRVHSNGNIYAQPQAQLTFQNDVTSVGNIISGKSPNDPSIRTPGTITFDAAHDSGVASLSLPIGTNNSPAAVHAIIEMPPTGESASSPMGQQRLYNQADLIILVNDSSVTVQGGNNADGNYGAAVPWNSAKNFIITTNHFQDQREGKQINYTQIDISKLIPWITTNTYVSAVKSIYVADLRTQSSSTEPGVKIKNGSVLPAAGLTIATPDPLYVQGNYNATGSALGSTNTSSSAPAALIADSINVLSGSWSDANSGSSLGSRGAADTTVDAAFLAGIVPSGNGYYSGGIENFPRFLEDWGGKTFTYNGSMVVMFPSTIGTGPWKGTGSFYNIYNPPTRNWNFDLNFNNPNKLPPMAPAIRVAIRGAWNAVAAN